MCCVAVGSIIHVCVYVLGDELEFTLGDLPSGRVLCLTLKVSVSNSLMSLLNFCLFSNKEMYNQN